MSITEDESDTQASMNLQKRNSGDVGWEYGVLVDANKDKVRCKICGHEST